MGNSSNFNSHFHNTPQLLKRTLVNRVRFCLAIGWRALIVGNL